MKVLRSLGVFATATILAISTAQGAVINEISASHDLGGPDFPQYFELYGTAGESLDGKSLVIVSNNATDGAGVILASFDLDGFSIGTTSTFFLIGNIDTVDTGDCSVTALDILNPDTILPIDLGRSYAALLMDTANIPNSGAGPLAGGETVEDGIDFDGDARLGTPLTWTGVPVAPPDFGFAQAGAYRTTDGVDTDTIGDWTFYVFVEGVTTCGSFGGTPTASENAAATSVSDWSVF